MKWLLALAVAAKLAAQCGVAPTPLSYDPANGGTAIPADAATYTISVDTGAVPTCAWKVTTAASWITLSEAGGTGSGSFTWTAALNPTNAQRKASIVLSGVRSGNVTISVVQLANTCTPALSASSAGAPVGGGPGSFGIQTACQWNAAGNQSWITVSPPANGTGNGTVNYTVSANGCVAARSGVITAQAGTLSASSNNAAAAFTINQDGAAGNLTLAPATIALGASGGSGKISLTTGTGCAWSAYTDAQSWIRIVTGTSGAGNSSISYNVSANTGASRGGHIFVGAQSVTISQDAAAAAEPQVTAVANAASYAAGPIAPGEVVALGGTGLGPTTGVGAQLAADGQSITTSLGGVQVLFDGQYPAALTYVSTIQINAIAPYEIAGKTSTEIQVSIPGGHFVRVRGASAAGRAGNFHAELQWHRQRRHPQPELFGQRQVLPRAARFHGDDLLHRRRRHRSGQYGRGHNRRRLHAGRPARDRDHRRDSHAGELCRRRSVGGGRPDADQRGSARKRTCRRQRAGNGPGWNLAEPGRSDDGGGVNPAAPHLTTCLSTADVLPPKDVSPL